MSEKDYNDLLDSFDENWDKLIFGVRNHPENNASLISKIPLLPIHISSSSFKILINTIYPLFMNEKNSSSIDIIINEENEVKNVMVHNNNFCNFQKYGINQFPYKKMELNENIEKIYHNLEDWAKKEADFDLGNIRIIHKSVIEKILDTYITFCEDEKVDLLNLFGNYLDILDEAFTKNKFKNFPNMPIFSFLFKLKTQWGNITFKNIYKIFGDIIPNETFTISFYVNENIIGFLVDISKNKYKIENISVPNNILLEKDLVQQKKNYLKYVKKKNKTKFNFLFDLEKITDLLLQIINSPIPIPAKRRIFIFEQILYFYKSQEIYWNYEPKLLIENGILRYGLYLWGLRFYTKKLSYWSIPKMLQTKINQDFGLTKNILLILSDFGQNMNNDTKNINYILETNNSQIHSIQLINQDHSKFEILQQFEENLPIQDFDELTLTQIRIKSSTKECYISHIVIINRNLLKDLIEKFVFKFHTAGYGIEKIFPILKSLTDVNNIRISPPSQTLEYLQGLSTFKLAKLISPIITDTKEF